MEGVGHPCYVADTIIHGAKPGTLVVARTIDVQLQGTFIDGSASEPAIKTVPIYDGVDGSIVARAQEHLRETSCQVALTGQCPLVNFLVNQATQ